MAADTAAAVVLLAPPVLSPSVRLVPSYALALAIAALAVNLLLGRYGVLATPYVPPPRPRPSGSFVEDYSRGGSGRGCRSWPLPPSKTAGCAEEGRALY